MKKLFFIFFISNSLMAQTIQPLSNYSLEDLLKNDDTNHHVIKACVSLYSAIIELTRKKYPDLANQFYEIANTIYPYGIISLKKIQNISYQKAEKVFFNNVSKLTDAYIDEMNKNGKKNGSYFKDSFLGNDLFFCHEITKSMQLMVQESIGE